MKVLLALSDSFVDSEPLSALAKQSGMTGAGCGKALAKLIEQDVIEEVPPFEHLDCAIQLDSVRDLKPIYRLTEIGTELVRVLS